MGWAGGSGLMGEVMETLQAEVKSAPKRRRIYRDLIRAFEDRDCDTLDECLEDDPAFDAAMRDVNPEHFEDEEEN